MTVNPNRFFSALLAVVYVVEAAAQKGGAGALQAGMFVMLPLACIWFPEAMGGFIGQSGRGYITSTSPALMICILGWVLLLLPVIMFLISLLAR